MADDDTLRRIRELRRAIEKLDKTLADLDAKRKAARAAREEALEELLAAASGQEVES